MGDSTLIQLVGGPLDGQERVIAGLPATFRFGVMIGPAHAARQYDATYRRKMDGDAVAKTKSGAAIYQWEVGR